MAVGAEVGQHGVGGVAGAVAGDQGRDLLGREAPLARPLAAPARPSSGRGVAAPPPAGALVGAAKEGLVRLDHAAQRLARRRGRPQEAVPPAEAGRQVHAAVRGRLGQAHAGRERLAVAQPARLLAQPRQRGAGQRVEGLAAGLRSGSGAARWRSPSAAAASAPQCGQRGAAANARSISRTASGSPEADAKARPSAVRCSSLEPLDQVQQHLEIRLAHRSPRRHPSTGSLPPNSRREKSLQKSLANFCAEALPEPPAAPVEVGIQDEARVGQQGAPTRVRARRCTRPRAPRDRRHAWAYLFGAVCPERAVGAALVLPYADPAATGLHLAEIGRHVRPGRTAWSCSTGRAGTRPATSPCPRTSPSCRCRATAPS